jgi:anti-sigma B factor antagonist
MEPDRRSESDRRLTELAFAKIDKPLKVGSWRDAGRMDMERQMGSSTRIERGTTIVDVVGQIDLGNSPALRKTLLESLKGTDCVAVNLIAVKYIDSSGIASLLEVLKEARQSKKRLVLFGLTAAVNQVLQLTRLTGVFEIRENEEQALEA